MYAYVVFRVVEALRVVRVQRVLEYLLVKSVDVYIP